jgi:molybdopterin-containing oxidoreductase family iron-sulfur binding subunit
MEVDRRAFLKIAGLSGLLALGGTAAFKLFAPGEVDAAMEAVPLTEAKQWAMVVDMQKCWAKQKEGECKDCILACDYVHNVPRYGDPKDAIKWIFEEPYEDTFPEQQREFADENLKKLPFLLLCNHCTNPPCCRVCPTKATWKREKDGIVMQDLHRCIGCRFCMAACPYGSRSLNWVDPLVEMKDRDPRFPYNPDYPVRSKGVVEKCTFCDQRVDRGMTPACVVACKKKNVNALTFGDLTDKDSNVRKLIRENYTIVRKPQLGTGPNVFYIMRGNYA